MGVKVVDKGKLSVSGEERESRGEVGGERR